MIDTKIIPTNCPLFGPKLGTFYFPCLGNVSINSINLTSSETYIISSVAYRYWMDEANKVYLKAVEIGEFHDRYRIMDDDLNSKHEEYNDNAVKWILWDRHYLDE